jgi:hypothetical protein
MQSSQPFQYRTTYLFHHGSVTASFAKDGQVIQHWTISIRIVTGEADLDLQISISNKRAQFSEDFEPGRLTKCRLGHQQSMQGPSMVHYKQQSTLLS